MGCSLTSIWSLIAQSTNSTPQRKRPEDFRKAFQLTAEGTIKFRCRRSIGCKRPHCSAKNNRSIDLYDLVALLDKKGREHARQVVSDFCERLYAKNWDIFQGNTNGQSLILLKLGLCGMQYPRRTLRSSFQFQSKEKVPVSVS